MLSEGEYLKIQGCARWRNKLFSQAGTRILANKKIIRIKQSLKKRIFQQLGDIKAYKN
jgi:hypothetical protein